MLLAVSLRRVGAVAALLGISCLLVAPVLPWAHIEPDRAFRLAGASPYDVSLVLVLGRYYVPRWSPAPAICILYLFPLLGSCVTAVEGLRAWQGGAATFSGIVRLLLSMGNALYGLVASSLLVGLAAAPGDAALPMPYTAGTGARLAALGFGAVLAGGALLAVGAFLHHWTRRRNDSRASATTAG